MNARPDLPKSPYTQSPKAIHIILIVLAWGLVSLLGLAASVAYGVWGWRLGGLHFAESWAEEQREELRYIDNKLLHRVGDLKKELLGENGEMGWEGSYKWGIMLAAETVNFLLNDERKALKYAARTGKDRKRDEEATAAHLAARYGRTALLRELLLRGANPDAEYICDSVVEMLLKQETPKETLLPVEERLAMLDFMHERGADLARRDEEGESGTLAYTASNTPLMEQDHGATLRWLLAHGVEITPADREVLSNLLETEGTLLLLKELHGDKQLDAALADAAFRQTLLLRTLMNIYGVESVAKLRWLIEDADCDPNLPTQPSDEEIYDDNGDIIPPGESLIRLCMKEMHSISEDAEQDAPSENRVERYLDALELLLQHGARPTAEWIERYAPANADSRNRYNQIFSTLPHTPPEDTTPTREEAARF